MIYDVSLSAVAVVLGLVYILSHLPGILAPARFRTIAMQALRNFPLGVFLAGSAGLWFCILTATQDLGELSPHRQNLMIFWVVMTVGLIVFVRQFLAVRGLAMLMLLAVYVMLDSAFLINSPARLLITIVAYIWAVAGITLIASPYLLRNAIEFVCKTDLRCRKLCSAGAGFGLLLIIIGLTVYPNIH